MKKKAIITGGTGFLGKAIIEKLIKANYLLFVLIRKESNLSFINHLLPCCKCIYYETLQDKELLVLLEDAMNTDLFIHCAWKGVSNIERDQISQITYNITLTIDAVILANNLKCKKWVGMGSQAEYGIVNDIAYEETTPISPFSTYGKSKVACYWAASGLCQIFGLPMLWCRIFSLYGINDNPNTLISYLIQSCLNSTSPSLTNCEQKWDYLYVVDGAEAIINLSESNEKGVFNIGSGKSVALREVVNYIKKQINPHLYVGYGQKSYAENQIMHLEADISKLKKVTNWKPVFDLQTGLSETINYYLKN
ncbi:NAD-dependent epimerase/dehydratase family protein [Arcicella rigui]|uniref:NAD(P)-dependent oxidoreductase n=1 Tax=Arcicella rigui TaxID=797020 RepID=A0ABU5QEK7_9BACT|nr:NAD(P)-dependent oxidoreductase [Arcicella rigui]MEA5141158.1 NAD(P)-dependent oxidoreductase [Arcicella rigui]